MNVYKNKKPAWVFLIPAFLFMAVFLYYPFLQNIVNSFMKIRNLGGGVKGVNNPFYKNYAELLTDPNMRVALKNTVIMIFVTLFGEVGPVSYTHLAFASFCFIAAKLTKWKQS